MSRWEILSGLPPYGPEAIGFNSSGQGKHREGFVVLFRPEGAEPWVGNFQPGMAGFADVVGHPNGKEVIVVAGGHGYIIDPANRKCSASFGGQIQSVTAAPKQRLLLLTSLTDIKAIGPDGFIWHTRRISWDGLRNLRMTDTRLAGEAYNPGDDGWYDFEVNLLNGGVTGGSFVEVK